MAERQRDVLALFGERAGDALRHFVDLVGDQIADRVDVVGEIEVDAGDGVADLLGLADQRFALVRQFAQEIADTDFVVVIGAFERRDFVVHQRFEFGGARQGALDAVAHGGDFAADGLTNGDDGFARRGVRLRQTHGDFRHGFRDQAHVLRAAEHVGDDVGKDHRHDDGADGDREHGNTGAWRREQRLQFVGKQVGGGQAAGGPGKGRDGRHDVRRARRAAAQRLQNLTDIGAVVVGGARCAVFAPGGRRGFVVEQICVGRRRRPRIVRAQAQLVLNCGERLFRRVFGFLRTVRHIDRRLVCTRY